MTPRRVQIESNIYRAKTGALEIGWRDASGRQRWRIVHTDIEGARAALSEALAEKREARDALAAELLRRDKEAKKLRRKDWAEAYGSVRKALQSLDHVAHVDGTGRLREQAQSALYRAEDHITEAMRIVY